MPVQPRLTLACLGEGHRHGAAYRNFSTHGHQRADQNRLLHGYETGVIMRSPEGARDRDHEGDYELDGQPADGHQFDGRHSIEGDELRH